MNNPLTILRSIIFPKTDISDKAELYYHIQEGSVLCCEDGSWLDISGTAAFDSYFNCLALVRYSEYCCLSDLFLRLRVSGSHVLRIFGVKLSDKGAKTTQLLQKELQYDSASDDITELTFALKQDFDHLYFTLSSEGGRFFGGEFLCGSEVTNGVNIGVVICTYKREKFLMRNHAAICRYLKDSTVFHRNNIHFYIVDNGQTLDPAAVSNEHITLIPNENTGGSGGFTRGYYEAVKSSREHTHILFMDDDIVLDCEMLLRVYALLRLRKPEHAGLSVGGTMLRLSDGVTQHEAGSVWDGKKLNSIGKGLDMTERQNVFDTALYPEGNYNAWWFFCFPARWQKDYGYPLQFFVKEDDIEYSLRCAGHIAVINGIAVWHDDFEGKYDGFQEYYIKRNELIMTSVNKQKPYALFQVRKLILSVMKQTVYQRYFLADLIFRAYRDYLRGWKRFDRTDTAALNRKLMASCLPLMSEEELKEKYNVSFDEEKYELSRTEPEALKKQALSMNGYLLPGFCDKKDKDGYSIADLADCRIVNFYRHKRVLHFDTKTRRGFVTVRKRRKLWWNLLRIAGVSIRFLICYPFVRRGYRKHLDTLAQYPKKANTVVPKK